MKVITCQTIASFVLLACVLIISEDTNSPTEDRLQVFYDRLKEQDVLFCQDRTRLLPHCKECIPGLEQSEGSTSCDSYVKETLEIRKEIEKLTTDRYGVEVLKSSRPYGLYPCKWLNCMVCGAQMSIEGIIWSTWVGINAAVPHIVAAIIGVVCRVDASFVLHL